MSTNERSLFMDKRRLWWMLTATNVGRKPTDVDYDGGWCNGRRLQQPTTRQTRRCKALHICEFYNNSGRQRDDHNAREHPWALQWWRMAMRHCKAICICELYNDGVQKKRISFLFLLDAALGFGNFKSLQGFLRLLLCICVRERGYTTNR